MKASFLLSCLSVQGPGIDVTLFPLSVPPYEVVVTRLGSEADQVAFPCIRDPSETIICNHGVSPAWQEWLCKTLCPISKWFHNLTKWCGHLWNASKWEEMEGIGFLQKWQTHPRARALPFGKPYKAEIFTLSEPALESMSLCPAVMGKSFGFVLTRDGRGLWPNEPGSLWGWVKLGLSPTFTGSSSRWGIGCSWAPQQQGTKGTHIHVRTLSLRTRTHATWLASPGLAHSGESVLLFPHPRPKSNSNGRL